jgi:hypothetical protein
VREHIGQTGDSGTNLPTYLLLSQTIERLLDA